jgi:hypothetical protein
MTTAASTDRMDSSQMIFGTGGTLNEINIVVMNLIVLK